MHERFNINMMPYNPNKGPKYFEDKKTFSGDFEEELLITIQPKSLLQILSETKLNSCFLQSITDPDDNFKDI